MPLADYQNMTVDVLAQSESQGASGAPVREPYGVVLAAVPVFADDVEGKRDTDQDRSQQTVDVRLYFDPVNLNGLRITTAHRLSLNDPSVPAPRVLTPKKVQNVGGQNRLVLVTATEVVN